MKLRRGGDHVRRNGPRSALRAAVICLCVFLSRPSVSLALDATGSIQAPAAATPSGSGPTTLCESITCSPLNSGYLPLCGFHLGGLSAQLPLGIGLGFGWTPQMDHISGLLTPELGFRGGLDGIAGDAGEVGSELPADTQGTSVPPQEQRGRETNVSAAWALGEALSLATSRRAHRVLDPTDEKYGLVSTEAAHTLNLQLSQSTKLTASMKQQGDTGEGTSGRLRHEDRQQRIEFTTGLGGRDDNSLKVAMTSLSSVRDGREATQRKTEAHLAVVPTTGLRLRADQLSARGENGQAESSTSVEAAFGLGAQMELKGRLQRRTSGTSSSGEGGISLQSALACGRLTSEHKRTRGSAGTQTSLKHAFSGGFGAGSARTNVTATFEQIRSEGTDGPRGGLRSLHADRQVAPAMRLTVDWHSKEAGTNATPTREDMATCQVQAKSFGGGELQAKLSQGRASDGAPVRHHELAFSRSWEPARLRLTQSLREDGETEEAVTAAYVDVPTGDLPAWVTTVPAASELEEAQKYLRRPSPTWETPEMPFAGYRVWTAHRDTAGGNERDTIGFAHRRTLAGESYLHLLIERCPTATSGAEKGHARPVQRYAIETTVPLSHEVRARCGYGVQTSLVEAQDRLQRVDLSLSRIRPSSEIYHVDIAYESGRWQGAQKSQANITLLYSRRVDEEDQLELKLRQTWGEGVDAAMGADCRLAFTYSKPI